MMAGGSQEMEHDDDQQCAHCGLWFSSAGVLSHEQHCNLAEFDRRLVELRCPFARMRADDVDVEDEPDVGADDRADEADEIVVDAPADPGADPSGDPTPESGGDPTDNRARTDGGPAAVPEFGESSSTTTVAVDGAGQEASDEPACPECGSTDLDDPEDALPAEALQQTPAVRKYDHICMACSTNAQGTLSSPVEVFNSE